MKKRKQLGGLLTVVLVLAALLGVYFSMDYINLEEEEEAVLFLQVEMDEIQAVTVVGEENSYTLEKADDVWTCLELPDEDISESQVEYKLGMIDEIVAVRVLGETEESLETYGLSEPQFRFTLTLSDGSTKEVCIGDQTPDGNDYAMLTGEETISTISTTVQLALDVSPDTYIYVEEETEDTESETTDKETNEGESN